MTMTKTIASITSVAALTLTAVACGGSSTPSSLGTPTPAQSSASAPAQGSATAAPTDTAVPPANSDLSIAALCNIALNQDSVVHQSIGSSPDTTVASSAMNTLGTDFIQDAVANSSGDPTLNADLTTFGGDAQALSIALSSGLPPSGAYTAVTDDANTLDQECGYAAGTF